MSTDMDSILAIEVMVQTRPLAKPVRPVVLPDADDIEDEAGPLGYAEGQHFIIEYTRADGAFSRRRITVRGISMSSSDGVPVLDAYCHERKAHRQFRTDRITCCIDIAGEIFDDVPAFLVETFGMAPELAAIRPAADGFAEWEAIRRGMMPEAVLLAGMVKSDGVTRTSEIMTAVDYLAVRAEKKGAYCDGAQCERLARLVRGLRPTRRAIESAIEALRAMNPTEQRAFMLAAVAVMDADGRRHSAEARLLDRMAEGLLGVRLFDS